MEEKMINATSPEMQNLSLEEQAKLLPPLTDAEPDEIAQAAHAALYNKKARNIKVYRVEGNSDIADYMVVGTGTSGTHVKTLCDFAEYTLEQMGETMLGREGHRGNTWELLDYGTIVIHVFTEEARKFYDLERLWADAEQVDISQFIIEEA